MSAKKIIFIEFLLFILGFSTVGATKERIFRIIPCGNDAISLFKATLDSIRALDGLPAVIELIPSDYHLSRSNSTPLVYHISNTASEKENPDSLKHIGILLKNISNLKIKGNGARIVTHGELTTFVIDSCSNIRLENFTITAADPTVTEIKILETNDTTITFETLPFTRYEIKDGVFKFVGDGWAFGDPTTIHYAWPQIYHPDKNVTVRCAGSPLSGYKSVTALSPQRVKMTFEKAPPVVTGDIYQFRHWIRNEVCGFVNLSKDISFENINFNFMGNFGLLSQFTENISFHNIRFAPDENSGRTNAGFADFLHFSGCKGKIRISDSFFCGAQDDAINVHGTHLKIVEQISNSKLKMRFMHPQTFGFQPFFPGNRIEIVNASTLNPIHATYVKDVERIDNYNFILDLTEPFLLSDLLTKENLVVENVTFTPEVEISGNRFERIPTRGILLTTRGKSIIENNSFYRLPMASILIADDASSWYESGPVKDLTIRGNIFIECNPPFILVSPEIKTFDGPVHSGIKIEDNTFYIDSQDIINIKGTSGISINNNTFISTEEIDPAGIIYIEKSTDVSADGNRLLLF